MSDAPSTDARAAASGSPAISILVPAHDSARTLPETLDSILAQTRGDWEVVVVDDGSTDDTASVARRYAEADPRIRCVSQANLGTAVARNAAAAMAAAPLLLPFDADDLLEPDAVERQLAFIDAHPGCDIYSFGTWRLELDGSKAPFLEGDASRTAVSFGAADLIPNNRILACSVIDADAFRRAGGYRDTYVEDYDLWLRMLSAGSRHLHNPEMLASYRARPESKSADPVTSMEHTATMLDEFARTPGLDADIARKAAGGARYWRSAIEWRRLEEQMGAGDFRGARRAAWSSREARGRGIRPAVGTALLLACPRLYAARGRR